MNVWIYRLFMALLVANLGLCIYMVATAPPVVPQCINGVVMVQNKQHTMYVQRAVFVAEQCIAIDTD